MAITREGVEARSADADVVYGLLRLAGMDVALPLSALREVVPCPAELTRLPAAVPGLLGAIELRRLVLPVLDLHAALGRPEDRRVDQVVVVLADEGRVLGLLADEVQGICRVPADVLVAAQATGGGLLFSHTFRHPETGRAHSVLDAGAVLDLPGVPTVTDRSRTVDTARGDGVGAISRRTLTVLRCGAYRLAIDAAHVHTTVPTPQLRPSVLTSRLCPGSVVYDDREVPVIDPLVLLGLGELPAADTGAGLVLDLESGYVVLALSELLELAYVDPDDVLPVPSFGLPRADLLAGMVEVGGIGDCLVLDGANLMTDPQLSGFAAVNTAVESARSGDDTAVIAAAATAGGAPPYLTYSIGVDLATRLEQISEILPFPDALTRTSVPGLLGLVTHRRAVVPVLCLSTLLGREQREVGPSTCLLLAEVDDRPVAFAVDALRSIAPLTWTDAEQASRGTADDRGSTLRSAPLVRVGEDSRLLPELDLRAVARRFISTADVLTAPEAALVV
ncbi:chemotaxis CheW protein [Modestobacter italicus]|uniref:Chemotaxis CheW protein n=1 Tax=Modestobacter italicus (strain DSM 44449 / CECT 9708 / BC 501) TaxID=2732864 RepID=I4F0S2_MODI5|nr:chemotaxis protein CheW [Modestobacter marinus]CCH89235.1 chemotaxis CheW protein [Modestobacter marinus]